MKKFYAYFEGKGHGCDYTIGCNLRVEQYDAKDVQEVVDIITEEIEESPDYAEERIEQVTIIEAASETTLDIFDLTSNIREKQLAEEQLKKEDEERAEYERLKKKFE